MKPLVTRDSIQNMLDNTNQVYVMHVVGKALVALFDRQTEAEKVCNHTQEYNGIGFAGCDARSGTLTAKAYLKNKRLEDWQVNKWTKPGKNGYARLCKYHSQLNEVAEKKARLA